MILFLHLLLSINPFSKILIIVFICQHLKKEVVIKNVILSFFIALLISLCSIPLAVLCCGKFAIEFSFIANICVAISFLLCAYWQLDRVNKNILKSKVFFALPLAFPLICGPNFIGVIFQYLTAGFSVGIIILGVCFAMISNLAIMLLMIEFSIPLREFFLKKIKYISICIFLCCCMYHFCLTWKFGKILYAKYNYHLVKVSKFD